MHNKQEVIGNLADDVQVHLIDDDRAVLNFAVASTHRYIDRKGNKHEHTEWFKVKTFTSVRAAQEFFEPRLTKGALVFVEGRTKTESFIKDDGEKGYSRFIECEPHNVKPLNKIEKADENREHQQSRQPQSQRRERPEPESRPQRQQRDAVPGRSDLMNFEDY